MEPTYYIRGLLRQANAKYARDYLEIVPGAGNGTVTNAINLANNAVAVGDGGTVGIKTIASLGAAGTVLTSNGAGVPPSFQAAPGGAGTVTNALNLSPTNAVVVADGGTTGVKTLAALGAAGTILTSNGAGVPPSFQAPAAGGNVTTSDTLDDNILIVGTGGVDVESLGSAGTTTTVLHGNAAGLPSFGAVVEADFGFTDITTANASTSEHGLLPKLSGDATTYLDGDGNFTPPSDSVFWREVWFVPRGTGVETLGTLVNQDAAPVAGVPATSTQCAGCRYTTTGVSGNERKMYDSLTNGSAILSRPGSYFSIITPENITDIRFFTGLSNSSGILASDAVVANYVGFRFSTAVPDTNWQAVCDNNSGVPTIVDTGVAPGTCQRFRLTWASTSSVLCYIDDVLVANLTTTIPTVNMIMLSGIRTLAASAKSWVFSIQRQRSR